MHESTNRDLRATVAVKRGQQFSRLLNQICFMPLSLPARACLAIAVFSVALAGLVSAQNAFSPGGPDYLVSGGLAGDQVLPHAAINSAGGWLVWQDNAADNSGLGIRALKVGANLGADGPPFRVNEIGDGDQERPQVALLSNGGALVVWQGGQFGFQKIFARTLSPAGTPSGNDILVNTFTNNHQVTPAVAVLSDGNVIVVWSSYGQDGSHLGIYGQRLSPQGAKLGSEFRLNQFVNNNQRTPSVAALPNGRFVVAWVSELQRGQASIDVYARIYANDGTPVGNEFPVNTSTVMPSANPSVCGTPDGGFAVAWSQREGTVRVSPSAGANSGATVSGADSLNSNSWDVFMRIYQPVGTALAAPFRVNSYRYGDQYAPKIASFGRNFLCVWVSLGQDSSWEGVFGQFLRADGSTEGVEFQVNTSPISRQIHPSLVTDGLNRFMVSWATFQPGTSFDLVARNYDLIHARIVPEGGSLRVTWNTQPGSVYQVQVSLNFTGWSNVGSERTAAALNDSVLVTPASAGSSYYRVIRVR